MLLSKALHLTDAVTESVTAHLPGPLAGPVHLAVSTLTWVPRQVVEHVHPGAGQQGGAPTREQADEQASGGATPEPTATESREPEPREPEVVLTLDRPAEELEPPIDVVGEALRAEAEPDPAAYEPPSPLEDEGHVEVQEEVVYSSSSDDA